MATTNTKLVSLELLSYYNEKISKVIEDGDAPAIKAVAYENDTLSFYKTTDKSDTPITVNLPEEFFLDQAQTTLVNDFKFADGSYGSAEDPNLDGKPVLVLAVKGETTTTYSFVNLEKLIDIYTGETSDSTTVTVSDDNKIKVDVKVSATDDNIVEVKSDGIYVPKTVITIAETSDIDAIFTDAVDNG